MSERSELTPCIYIYIQTLSSAIIIMRGGRCIYNNNNNNERCIYMPANVNKMHKHSNNIISVRYWLSNRVVNSNRTRVKVKSRGRLNNIFCHRVQCMSNSVITLYHTTTCNSICGVLIGGIIPWHKW